MDAWLELRFAQGSDQLQPGSTTCGTFPSSAYVFLQALAGGALQGPPGGAWELKQYRTGREVVLQQGESVIDSRPVVPYRLDGSEPEEAGHVWLGERLCAVRQHMRHFEFALDEAPPGSRCGLESTQCSW